MLRVRSMIALLLCLAMAVSLGGCKMAAPEDLFGPGKDTFLQPEEADDPDSELDIDEDAWIEWNPENDAAPSYEGKQITVTVIHKNGEEITFTYDTNAEYLAEVLLDEGLIDGYTGEYGFVIETVDGETASWENGGAYWSVRVDGEYATTGVSDIPVYDGSVFTLVYEMDKADLAQYLNTSIYDFVDMMGDMRKVATTDGSTEFSNENIYVSSGFDAERILFISFEGECAYAIKGIEYGMSISDAVEIATESCDHIERDLPHFKLFEMKDGTRLYIYAENETTVNGVTLSTDQ